MTGPYGSVRGEVVLQAVVVEAVVGAVIPAAVVVVVLVVVLPGRGAVVSAISKGFAVIRTG